MKAKDFNIATTLKNVTVAGDDEKVTIEGWANLAYAPDGSSLPDSDGEIVLPDGIDLSRFNRNPIMLWAHNGRDIPVGKFIEVTIKPEGLWVKGEVYKALNEEVYNAVRLNVLNSFSIGFRGKNGRYLDGTDIFVFTEVELHEISIVTVPAAEQSQFGVVKSLTGYCFGGVCKAKHNLKEGVDMDAKDATLSDVVKAIEGLKELLEPKEVEKDLEEVEETVEVEEEVEEVIEKEFDVLKELDLLDVTADNFEAVVGAITSLNSKCNALLNLELGDK